ncbi:MAG: hypothetical protein J1F63_02715 [Oscillospiraceae bacterium]|nr:hypothetical protein [Oscillospiraceae bacterium]
MSRAKYILSAIVFAAILTAITATVLHFIILRPPYLGQVLFYLRDDAEAFKALVMRVSIGVACLKLIPGIGADLFKRLSARLFTYEKDKFSELVADLIFPTVLLGIALYVRFLV